MQIFGVSGAFIIRHIVRFASMGLMILPSPSTSGHPEQIVKTARKA